MRNHLMVGLIVVFGAISLVGIGSWWPSQSTFPSPTVRASQLRDKDIVQLSITTAEERNSTQKQLEVLVVKSTQAMERGLSGKSAVPAQGMLFILPERVVPRFWMKEMLFDIDMVWIDAGTIIDISRDVPAPDPSTPLADLPIYSPVQPATMVLEIPAGKSVELGIEVGDRIRLTSK